MLPGQDGLNLNPQWAPDGKSLAEWGLGILFVGEKGMLAADYGRALLLPAAAVGEAIGQAFGTRHVLLAGQGMGATLALAVQALGEPLPLAALPRYGVPAAALPRRAAVA